MRKELNYLILFLSLLFSCEQIYEPKIDTVNGQLVVEAQITNDLTRNFVHMTRTRSFYDRQPPLEVSGATVDLVELQGKPVRANESSPGYYVFTSVPETGKTYFLRIKILNDLYESAAVVMPPLPTLTNCYSEPVVKKVYITNGEGKPQPFDKQLREFYVDMPVTKELSYYRYDIKTIWQWHCDLNPQTFSEIPSYYGWYVYHEIDKFNLAGPKNFSQVENIQKYPLLTVTYNILDYLHTDTLFTRFDTLYSRGCILAIDQYGTSKESYEFHTRLNSQFAATGSLFDPVQTQIFGNILCKTDPAKIVFGYFDLNSYAPHRYFFHLPTLEGDFTFREILRYPEIPDSNGLLKTRTVDGPPDERPPLRPPVWWERY
jgi:hypothetical protein